MNLIYRYTKIVVAMAMLPTLVLLYSCGGDDPPPVYTLTVNSGTGSGQYEEGEAVSIAANAPASGEAFSAWSGDVSTVADVNSATTTLTMPARNISVTATYQTVIVTYTLTVNNGSGSGSYEEGETVTITADPAPAGQTFVAWTGDVANVADVNAASTTVTMPSSSISVTATYQTITYTLTVTNGSGSGDYEEGAVVQVIADPAPDGQYFDQWTGDVAALDDVTNDTANLTMPAAAVSIAASYLDKPTISVVEGTWRIDKFFEKFDTDDFVEVVSAANDNFRVTFEFDESFMPSTYSMVLGAVLAVPNYNSESNSGTWSVDDPEAPTTLTFDEGDMASIVTIESATADRVIISWTVPSTIEGKPDRSFKIELIPA